MRRLLGVLATLALATIGSLASAGTPDDAIELNVVGEQGTRFKYWIPMRPEAYPSPSGSIFGWCGNSHECGRAFVKVNRDKFRPHFDSEDDLWLDRGTTYLFPLRDQAEPLPMSATMADIDAFYTKLCADIARLEGRVVAVEGRVTIVEGDIDAVEGAVKELAATFDDEIAALRAEMFDKLDVRDAALKSEIDEIRKRTTDVEAENIALDETLARHEGRLDKVEQNVAQYGDRLVVAVERLADAHGPEAPAP